GKVLGAGEFYFGLTRDDVAGLKFLYSSNNYAAETLLPTVSRDVNFKTSPWIPVIGIGVTNGTGTNVVGGTNAGVVVQALRGGVEKIQFQRVNFDSLLSQNFRPITNRYKDFIITNLSNGKVKWAVQRVQRAILQPDILFTAEPLGVDQFSEPFIAIRTDTAAWLNNDAIDGSTGQGGPGVIPPQVRIAFTDEFPISLGTAPDQVSDGTVFPGVVWGSFDETDAPPIIYPVNPQLTLEELQAILNGGSGN
ncbi:MAG TPA: hypothetical protein VNO52_00980, partial [Methylomirabilota bacterium]|nr:hypothetical protein [Methylomirabilota bacterium]